MFLQPPQPCSSCREVLLLWRRLSTNPFRTIEFCCLKCVSLFGKRLRLRLDPLSGTGRTPAHRRLLWHGSIRLLLWHVLVPTWHRLFCPLFRLLETPSRARWTDAASTGRRRLRRGYFRTSNQVSWNGPKFARRSRRSSRISARRKTTPSPFPGILSSSAR